MKFTDALRCGWRVTAVNLVALLAGCATSLQALPLPAPVAGAHSYALSAVFSNALNLPAKAKVKLHGADIGEVDSIEAESFTARVHMRIRPDVQLGVGSTAELRSATLLGDVFVQLTPPNNSPDAALLHDGDAIPLASTAAAPTVEELFDSMALLVNGGAVRQLVSIVNGAGQAVGGRGEKLATLLHQTRVLLADMTARSGQLTSALRGTADLAATMAQHRAALEESLTAAAPATTVLADNATKLADLSDGVARITRQLSRFPSIQGTDTQSAFAELNRLAGVFNELSVDPDQSLTAFNRMTGIFLKMTNATSGHIRTSIEKLSLAPWPDKNYPGDPGFHWPDGTDYHQMIGGLRYEWNLFLDRIYGDQRWNPAAPR